MSNGMNERVQKYANELMKIYGTTKQTPPQTEATAQLPVEPNIDIPSMNDKNLQKNVVKVESIINAYCYNEYGSLIVETSSARDTLPVSDALVIVTRGTKIYGLLVTGLSGKTRRLSLPAPPRMYSEIPEASTEAFAMYDTAVHCNGYYTVKNIDVAIFADIDSILPVNMIPLPVASGPREINLYN